MRNNLAAYNARRKREARIRHFALHPPCAKTTLKVQSRAVRKRRREEVRKCWRTMTWGFAYQCGPNAGKCVPAYKAQRLRVVQRVAAHQASRKATSRGDITFGPL